MCKNPVLKKIILNSNRRFTCMLEALGRQLVGVADENSGSLASLGEGTKHWDS